MKKTPKIANWRNFTPKNYPTRDHEGINGTPRGMKSYPKQFNKFSYYEHLQIAHLFDTMHSGKNVTETLWRLLELMREKYKVVEVCKDIQESNHAMKDVIQCIFGKYMR